MSANPRKIMKVSNFRQTQAFEEHRSGEEFASLNFEGAGIEVRVWAMFKARFNEGEELHSCKVRGNKNRQEIVAFLRILSSLTTSCHAAGAK